MYMYKVHITFFSPYLNVQKICTCFIRKHGKPCRYLTSRYRKKKTYTNIKLN